VAGSTLPRESAGLTSSDPTVRVERLGTPKTSWIRNAEARFAHLVQGFGFSRPTRWLYFLLLAMVIDAVLVYLSQVVAYDGFYTFSQDFGSFNQLFYTTAFDGRLFYYTSNIPAGTGGSFFAVHFSPLMFVVVPFYSALPSPLTLFAIKAIFLALGALPLFGLAHRRLGSAKWAFVLGLVYLLSPMTVAMDWTSFDMEVFMPFMFLASFYYLHRQRYVGFLVYFGLSLATLEPAADLLAAFAFMAVLGAFWGSWGIRTPARRKERWVLFAALLLTVLWVGLSYVVLRHFSSEVGTFGSNWASHYTVLGAGSLVDVFPQALLHPSLAGAALSYDGMHKLAFVLVILGGLAFFPVFGELRYSLPAAVYVGAALLCNYQGFYSIGSQYVVYASPFLFAGAIGGIVFWRDWLARQAPVPAAAAQEPKIESPISVLSRRRRGDVLLGGTLVLGTLIALAVANPLLASPAGGLTSLHFGVPQVDAHAQFLASVLGLVPPGASILTTPHVFPQVSSRPNAYVIPSSQVFVGNTTYWGWLDDFINRSQYVVLDFVIDSYSSQLMQYFGNYAGFGVVVASSGVVLLERGWHSPPLPQFWQGPSVVINATGSEVAALPRFANPPVLIYGPTRASNKSAFLAGPALIRPAPGEYRFSVLFSSSKAFTGTLFRLNLTATPFMFATSSYLQSSFGHHLQYTLQRAGDPQTTVSIAIGSAASAPPDQLRSVSVFANISSLSSYELYALPAGAQPGILTVYGVTVTCVGQIGAWG
jgi:uncharacterized membrane protein